MESRLEVAVITDTQTFATLEEEWEELYDNSPLSTPFQSWSWLYSWWEYFGEGYQLRLLTVRDGDLLVGLIPLMLERKRGFCRLLFIGRSGQLDLLVRKGWEDGVFEAIVQALKQLDSWHVTELRNMSPTAAAYGVLQRWSGPRTCRPITANVLIEVKPWNELLRSLSRKHRSTVRRTLRRAEENGVHAVLAEPKEAEQAARRLAALHRELLQRRHINSAHLTPEFESFVVTAARRMTDRGLGGIYEFWRDGEVFMSSLILFGDKITDAYLVGVNQEAKQRYQWSSLGIWAVLNMARSRDSAYVCLADRGEPGMQRWASNKQRWASKEVPYYEIILGRNTILCSLYSTWSSLLRKVAKHTKADSTPTFIKYFAEWLKWR